MVCRNQKLYSSYMLAKLVKLTPLTFRPLFYSPSMSHAAGRGLFYNNSIWLSWAATRFSKSQEGLWLVAATTLGYQYVDLFTRYAEKFLSPNISKNTTVGTAATLTLEQIREFASNAIVYSTLYINSEPMISAAVSFLPETKRKLAGQIFEHVITATAIQTSTAVSYGAKHASNALVPVRSTQVDIDRGNASFFSPGNSFAGIIICAAGYIVRDYIQKRLEERIGKYPSILIAGALKGGMCSILKGMVFGPIHPGAKPAIPAMLEGAVYDCFTTIAGSYLGEKPQLLIAIAAENVIEKLTVETSSKICGFIK